MQKKLIMLVILCFFLTTGCTTSGRLNWNLFPPEISLSNTPEYKVVNIPKLGVSSHGPDNSSSLAYALEKNKHYRAPRYGLIKSLELAEDLLPANREAILSKKKLEQKETPSPPKKIKVSELIDEANKKGKRKPTRESYHNSQVIYQFEENIMYAIFTAVGKTTDICFQKGESIESIVAGDTANWIIAQENAAGYQHLFIKPKYSGLSANLTVLTNKRAYWFDLKSWEKTFMPGCKFQYPNDHIKKNENPQKESIIHYMPDDLAYNFAVKTECKDCIKPLSISENVRIGKTYIIMPEETRHKSLPVLFDINQNGKEEITNYRFLPGQRKFVLDGLYKRIMLKYGDDGREIHIYRTGSEPK